MSLQTESAAPKRPPGLIRVPLSPVTQKGFDISSYNKVHDWDAIKAAGFFYGGFKASEGITWSDPTFLANWAAAEKAGLKRIAYYFFHPKDDPAAQAANFLRMTRGVWKKGDRVMLDWEVTDGVLAKADVAAGQKFINLVKVEDVDCVIYAGPYFAQDLGLDPSYAAHPLMVAEYGGAVPLIPPPWAKCTFWQFSDKGNVPGIGACDVSLFNGTSAELDAFFA